MRVQRPGSAVAAGRRPLNLAGERLLCVQLDQPAEVARLLRTIPGADPMTTSGVTQAFLPLLTGSRGAIANVL